MFKIPEYFTFNLFLASDLFVIVRIVYLLKLTSNRTFGSAIESCNFMYKNKN